MMWEMDKHLWKNIFNISRRVLDNIITVMFLVQNPPADIPTYVV